MEESSSSTLPFISSVNTESVPSSSDAATTTPSAETTTLRPAPTETEATISSQTETATTAPSQTEPTSTPAPSTSERGGTHPVWKNYIRVSIRLADPSLSAAGFPIQNISQNPEALAYRAMLEEKQQAFIDKLSAYLGEVPIVHSRMTRMANVIAIEVPESVLNWIETQPEVKAVSRDEPLETQGSGSGAAETTAADK